jgi:hypothetical protein
MEYEVNISPKMRAVNGWLIECCVGMNFCMYELDRNLVVETAKSECELAVSVLKEKFPDVVLINKAYNMLEDLHDFILVKQMISESPCVDVDGVPVPVLEKHLVDLVSDKMYAHHNGKDVDREFQLAFDTHKVNQSRMLRYASRKGKKEEVQEKIAALDKERIATIKAIQEYLAGTPFEKVWMFGSFSRKEETPDSDIDLLAQLDVSRKMGLFELSGIVLGLEEVSHRDVDLVMEGSVKPFARESIERDKVLIYERGR